MSKTLVVTYTPRNERSSTKQLVDIFIQNAKETEIEMLDLLKDIPDFFLEENLAAYYKRNYMGQELTESEKKAMSKMDRMTEQFKSADFVVLAYPMYNFSCPAIVKAYFDSVLLKGETWDMGPQGFFGKMQGKKALILSTSGGVYSEANNNLNWNHSEILSEQEFQFMGFDYVKAISAQGINMTPEKKDEILKEAEIKIKEVTTTWYKI